MTSFRVRVMPPPRSERQNHQQSRTHRIRPLTSFLITHLYRASLCSKSPNVQSVAIHDIFHPEVLRRCPSVQGRACYRGPATSSHHQRKTALSIVLQKGSRSASFHTEASLSHLRSELTNSLSMSSALLGNATSFLGDQRSPVAKVGPEINSQK